MNPPHSSSVPSPDPTPDQLNSALFANLVIQQTNMALMLLGRLPNPETGEPVQDLEGARMFIDQLSMLEVKTKGNLDNREQQLLKQSLTTLRMAFVEAIDAPRGTAPLASAQPAPEITATPSADKPASSPTPAEEEHRARFTKKY